MPLSLDQLVPEVLGRLIGYSDLHALLALSAAGRPWRSRVSAADGVWRSCYRARFGRPPEDPPSGSWSRAYRLALEEEKSTTARWSAGAGLHQERLLIFDSFVRSWASDDELLVAGLYDGRLQPMSWRTGRVGRPFRGGHSDEVVCVALNDRYVLSGSGDPGYHGRNPTDSSVKLWTRAGVLQASFREHEDTVRGVALFPSSTGLGEYGLSAGLDAQVVLWSLQAQQQVSFVRLPGPCRCLRPVIAPDWSTGEPEGGAPAARAAPEVRALAAAGDAVAELAVRLLADGQGAELVLLQVVSVRPQLTASLDCFVSPKTWAQQPPGAPYPASLLLCPNVVVAGGSTDGRLWALGPQRKVCGLPSGPLGAGSGLIAEVVSVEILEGRQLLALSRTGVLCLAEWGEDVSEASIKWAKQGWRMYVSTMRRRKPGLLVTDGFDNAIGVLRVGDKGEVCPRIATDEEEEEDDEDDDLAEESSESA